MTSNSPVVTPSAHGGHPGSVGLHSPPPRPPLEQCGDEGLGGIGAIEARRMGDVATFGARGLVESVVVAGALYHLHQLDCPRYDLWLKMVCGGQ